MCVYGSLPVVRVRGFSSCDWCLDISSCQYNECCIPSLIHVHPDICPMAMKVVYTLLVFSLQVFYTFLMYIEFGVGEWLEEWVFLYGASHQVIQIFTILLFSMYTCMYILHIPIKQDW